MTNIPNYDYNPMKYYLITISITWIAGFTSAFLSYNEAYSFLSILAVFIGLITPAMIAIIMIVRSDNNELKADFKNRFFSLSGLNRPVILGMFLLLLPLTFLLAVLLSIVFGGDTTQLAMSSSFFSAMFIPLLASFFEEIGWRGYGVDALRKSNNLFRTSIIHWVMWSLWHVPLFFIKGFYHHELYLENPWLVVNYFISILPLTFVFNWVYFKTDRSILIAVLFHLNVNAAAEIFAITEGNKVFQTIVLGIFTIFFVFLERDFFFKNNFDQSNEEISEESIS